LAMIATAFASACFLLTAIGFAQAADTVADFYRGHNLYLEIGSSPGGIYDVTGRIVAQYLGKYIPGQPKIIVEDVPGGGSLVLANQFGNTTPRDGSVLGIFNDGMPTTPLTDPSATHFDPRTFIYIGSPTREAHVLIVWRNSPVQTYADLFKRPLIIGATSPGAAPYDFPFLANALIGTKFDIVTGYEGGFTTKVAMQRGEINGEAGLAWGSYKTDFVNERADHDVKILAAFGMKKNPELMDVPLLPLGSAQDQQLFRIMYARQDYGRLFLLPPGVPGDRVAALRDAFVKTMNDPQFKAAAERALIDPEPVTGEELQKLTEQLYQTPASIIRRLQQLMRPKT
jgi:tripartite-type tricarboxylate transporter receptor subunit TctC